MDRAAPQSLPVQITVEAGHRAIPVDDVGDARVAAALRAAGQNVGRQLAAIRCPLHGTTATAVRIHFDSSGRADLKYESCCQRLGDRIREALG